MAISQIQRSRTLKTGFDAGWFFILILTGYPFVALAGILVDAKGLTVSWVFRIAIAAVAALILLTRFGKMKRIDVPVAVVLFLGLYLLRLIVDATSGLWEAPKALGYFLAFVLVPAAGMIAAAAAWNDPKTSRLLFFFGWLTCALMIAAQAFHLTDRGTTELISRLSYDVIDPITVGVLGATCVVAGIAYLERTRALSERLVILAGIGTGLAVLVQSASRGPLIALVATLVLFLVVRRRWLWLAALGLGCAVYALTQPLEPILRTLRFTDVLTDASSTTRQVAQRLALDEFLHHPLFGSFYTETITGSYPHNLTIESAMAMGVGGLFLFICTMWAGLYFGVKAVRRGSFLAPMMFAFGLIEAQFSGGLWNTFEIWVPLIVVFRAWRGPTVEARSLVKRQRSPATRPRPNPAGGAGTRIRGFEVGGR